MPDLKLVRHAMHGMSSGLRSAADQLGKSDIDPVPPDCGKLTAKAADVLSSFNMVAANYSEMLNRAADDVDASAKTYDGTEDNNVHQLENLDTHLPEHVTHGTVASASVNGETKAH